MVNSMLYTMLRSVLDSLDWRGIALKAVLAIVVVVLVVTLVTHLYRLPRDIVEAKFKRSAGIELNAPVVNKFLCRRCYSNYYAVKYLPKDKDESYYYELHLPQGYSRRQKRKGFPRSFIHVPGFIIETDNPYTLWSLLEGISEAKGIDVVMSNKSDKVFVEPSNGAEISRMLPGDMVSDRMSAILNNGSISEGNKEALCVVMQEWLWFKNEVLEK